jgi:arginase
MPYSGARNVPEINPNPAYLETGGLVAMLEELGAEVKPIPTVALTTPEEREYGEWHRLGLANAHLGETVAENERGGYLSVGLLANCSSVMGVLGGLQKSGPSWKPLKVGLVFIDAHGDFNTPESTLSGMLGGMPVAVSAGMCLRNLRETSGLDPALPTRYIVMGAVRDTDPLEQELIDRSEIEHITVDDIRKRSENIHAQMERLSSLVDKIYIHIDMDVLDPDEVAGHPLTVPNGPTSLELADALTEMFRYEKAAALGIASTPAGERDPGGLSRKAAYNLVRGALKGIHERGTQSAP